MDWKSEKFEPRATELSLERQAPSDPFGRRPNEGEHDGADQEYLAPKDLGRAHSDRRSGLLPTLVATGEECRLASGILWRADRTQFVEPLLTLFCRPVEPSDDRLA